MKDLKDMKRRTVTLLATVVGTLALTFAGTAGANAATTPSAPTPSATGGIITICPGTTLNLDDAHGVPLSMAAQRQLINSLVFKCENPDAPASGEVTSSGVHSFAVTPDATTIPGVGYLAARLSIAPGSYKARADASSLAAGSKTLTCDYEIGGGAWQICGGPILILGSSGQTSQVEFCPVPGQPTEVMAWLDYKGAQYYDSVYGTTK
ncbi:hypothetical protein [Humibacter albus]|uniref:hypothetical protein n=1 Tax=Humibacter albus TaxID=427754 RepID=UPI0012FC4DDA|nr:hypothetical protein [Humibacter albus]